MSEAQCPACRRVAMARTSSALIVSAVVWTRSRKAAGDPLLDGQECHHVDELVDLQVRQVILDLEDRRRFAGEPVVAVALAAAVPPLRQTDDGVRPAGAGQEQSTDRLRHVALQVMGVVGHAAAEAATS